PAHLASACPYSANSASPEPLPRVVQPIDEATIGANLSCLRVIADQAPLQYCQCSVEARPCLCALPECVEDQPQIVAREADLGVVPIQARLLDRKRALVGAARAPVVPRGVQEAPQVAEADGRVRMVRPQRPFLDRQRPLQVRASPDVVALRLERHAEVVEA